MLITKNQLTGFMIIAGLTLAAATGCQKESVNPVKAAVSTQPLTDSVGIGGSGDEDGPKFPPRNVGRIHLKDTIRRAVTDDSGDEDGPKFPPHIVSGCTHTQAAGTNGEPDGSGDEDGPKFPPHVNLGRCTPKPARAAGTADESGDEDGPKFPPH